MTSKLNSGEVGFGRRDTHRSVVLDVRVIYRVLQKLWTVCLCVWLQSLTWVRIPDFVEVTAAGPLSRKAPNFSRALVADVIC